MEEEMNEDDVLEAQATQEELDPSDPNYAFAMLEREYNQIYAEMEENPQLAQYAEEYSKVFDFLYKTYERASELDKQKIELEETIKSIEEQLQASVINTKADVSSIKSLKTEIENSHKLIDNAHAREQAAQETIDNLRRQIANLNVELDFKNKMAQSEMEENPQVTKHREGLEREKVKLLSEVSKLNEKLNNALAYQDELERRTSVADLKITEISTQLEETSADMERYKRNKEKLEVELELEKAEIVEREAEIVTLNEKIASDQKLINKYEGQLKEQISSSLKCFKELEGWNAKYMKLQDDIDTLNFHNESMKKDLVRAMQDTKLKNEERARLHIDYTKLQKLREISENKTKRMEIDKIAVIEDRNKLREIIGSMEMDIQGSKRQADADRRAIENTGRERDILNKNILRQQAVARDHQKIIKVQDQVKRKLELEIDSHVIETRKLKKQISYLEKERDRLLEEELELTKKIEDTMDDVKLKKNEIFDLKKSVTENENKLRMQQNLFDAVRTDKNNLQKALQESSAENFELKNKLRTINHQTEQMKEDIASKEQLLIKEENILRKINKEKENMKIELNVCWDQIRSLKDDIAERKTEEKRLHKVIVTSDRTIRDQAKTLTQLMNERDVLGAQLVRRNDEISLLYEKIKILQTTLHRGEAQYDQRLQDIKLLKVEIKRLRQEKILLTKSIKNMNDLKQEVFHLERDLTKERLKTKALEDELQNPMNVHRWRKLEGSDPEVYELLQKTTLLQKRLLLQATKTVGKEKQLKETEKLYMNLRQVLSKQPGPEIFGQIIKLQKELASNTAKMKCLVSELNLTESQSYQYKLQLERLTEECKEVKKKLLHEKKQHAKDLDSLKELTSKINQEAFQGNKFNVGGGFRLPLVNK